LGVERVAKPVVSPLTPVPPEEISLIAALTQCTGTHQRLSVVHGDEWQLADLRVDENKQP